MRIAISSEGKDENSNVSEVFGRCHYFLFAEIKDGKAKKIDAVENTSANQLGSAGTSAAKIVAENGAEALISKNVGPRALDIFKQLKIDVYMGSGAVNEVLQRFIDKKLKKIR